MPNDKKRKVAYEEEDDGFAFTRVKKQRQTRQTRQSIQAPPKSPPTKATSQASQSTRPRVSNGEKAARVDERTKATNARTKQNRLSFSTPKSKDTRPLRRSKRLSNDAQVRDASPEPPAVATISRPKRVTNGNVPHERSENNTNRHSAAKPNRSGENEEEVGEEHAATKIALPFADTPVMRRNKAMREGRGSKGDRRSSLSLRGRRASSLIDTGTSNALPHQEVAIEDFYKHIESDLLEPRRMRQLLMWSATRAMHLKPKGTDFEDASAKSAARVIEEELLGELAHKSELTYWFDREDTAVPAKSLPERPHPKNVQNIDKIAQLEEQIRTLRAEKEALEALLKPPAISGADNMPTKDTSWNIDRNLLSAEDTALLESLESTSGQDETITQRVNSMVSTLGPTIDTFADGVHQISVYRKAADDIAQTVLSICAGKLAAREKEGRRKALHIEDDRSPGKDLGSVLRGLSKADR